MKRIDTSSRAVDLFGPGKDGFKEAIAGVSEATKLKPNWFNHVQEAICRTIETAGLELSETDYDQFVTALQMLINSTGGIKSFASGVALPTLNQGPIWHDDYNSLMTWQKFDANGAAYEGYASILIGNLLLDTQPTPRQGYVKSGVSNLSRTTYAALRGWAMHNGIMVAEDTWAAGDIAVKDNTDGTTFTIYDVRGEFLRAWDDGRGADQGRAFGKWQKGSLVGIDTNNDAVWGVSSGNKGIDATQSITGLDSFDTAKYTGAQLSGIGRSAGLALPGDALGSGTSGVARPNNTALLAAIKF